MRRRTLAVIAAGVAVIAGAGLLFGTNLLVPDGRYAAPPEACDLLDRTTLAELLGGPVEVERRFGSGSSFGLWTPTPRESGCILTRTDDSGSAVVGTRAFPGARLGIGPSPDERARQEVDARATSAGDCQPLAEYEGCVTPDVVGWQLYLVHENLSILVAMHSGGRDGADRVAAEIAERLVAPA